nr:hypothetical protein [Proteus mirabilis]
MQAEWQRIKNSPNGRYHLLTQNCSSIVAKVLKAGGADELIGYNWQPKYNIWTPKSNDRICSRVTRSANGTTTKVNDST